MVTSRRGFIGKLGLTAIGAVAMGSVGNLFGQARSADDLRMIPPESLADPLNYLTSKHFQPFVDTSFRIVTGERKGMQLALRDVRELSCKANESRGYSGESFSLLFENLSARKLVSRTYQLRHDALGSLSLLLVAVGAAGTNYEAIINRISK